MELTDEKLAAWDGACEDPICVECLTPETIERVMGLVDRACDEAARVEREEEWCDEVAAQMAADKRRGYENEIRRILRGDHIPDVKKMVSGDHIGDANEKDEINE